MAKRPTLTPVVPGEAPSVAPEDLPQGFVAGLDEVPGDALGDEGDAPKETPAAEPKEVPPASQPVVTRQGELPDAADIDPKTITRSVLTKQGIVVPASSGR